MNLKEKALQWAKQFETSKRWLSAVKAQKTGSEATQLEYAYRLQVFCEWANKTPDQLIAERKEQTKSEDEFINRKTEELVTDFFNFQSEKLGNRMSPKAFHGALRSFYKYNYAQPLRMETPRAAVNTIIPITLDEFKQIDAVVNPRDRALTRFMKDSGISTRDCEVLDYGDIKKEFEAGNQFIHIRAMRHKTLTNYDTFIGPNAVEALKCYFQIRKTHGEVFTDKSPLFLANKAMPGKETRRRLNGNSIRTVFERIAFKTGLIVSPHRIRKMFETLMSVKVHSPVVLKYWMGHSVESSDIEGRYIIPPVEDQRKIYIESYCQIDITPKSSVASEGDLRIKIALDNLRQSGRFSDSTLKQIETEWLGKEPAIAIPNINLEAEAIQRIADREGIDMFQEGVMISKDAINNEMEQIRRERSKPKTANNGGCADGLNCQRLVNEKELETLLTQGWHVVLCLPSGKIVVGNEH